MFLFTAAWQRPPYRSGAGGWQIAGPASGRVAVRRTHPEHGTAYRHPIPAPEP